MRVAIRSFVQPVYRTSFPARRLSPSSCRATISTNSAIHRELRKSGSAGGRISRVPRRDGQRTERPWSRESRETKRVPRPNHAQKQDVEDMRESARIKESTRSPRQQNYIEGGRKPSARFDRFPSEAGDRWRGENFAKGSTRATDRYAKDKSPSFAAPTSDRLNRAARRAAIFGPGDTPPQRDREIKFDRSSSRRRTPFHERNPNSAPWHDFHARKEGSERPLTNATVYDDEYDERPQRLPRFNGRSNSSGDDGRETEGKERRYFARSSKDDNETSDVPVSIPYTTPASEFLYGTSVVSAALKFSSRRFYKFYSYFAPDRVNVSQDAAMCKLASSRGVEVKQVQGEWMRVMDKMSTGRPHNGYILEASPLPKLPVTGLQSAEKPFEDFYANLDHQSREEENINGRDGRIEYSPPFARYPVVLMLDGIVDPGNLGALLRTAHFFGVDAVAISTRNCAPFSPITLKASAGASESLKILSVSHPENFVDESQRNGWNFYAAVAPGENAKISKRRPYYSTSNLECPATAHPTVLMLGGEGEGLRDNLRKRADNVIGIEGQRIGQGGVDSLNVSVAAGILCEAFLRKPSTRKTLLQSTMASEPVFNAQNNLF